MALVVPPGAGEPVLVVLNKSGHTASFVDPATFEVLAEVPTGVGPHELAVSPDRRLAYVADYGQHGRQAGNTITVLDLEKRAVVRKFDLGEFTFPHGIVVSRDGRLLWVTCEGAQAVIEVDTASGAVLRHWKTGQDLTHLLIPTPDERKLYTANLGSGSASVIDRQTGEVKTIPTGLGPEGIGVSADGREVWVANWRVNSISIIDTATDRVRVTFSSGGRVPIRLIFTPDGRRVWVSNLRSDEITVFDAATRQVVDRIPLPGAPITVSFSPDGRRAVAALPYANQLAVIELPGNKVLRTFTTGLEPDGNVWLAPPVKGAAAR